jgi:hypothetical protein
MYCITSVAKCTYMDPLQKAQYFIWYLFLQTVNYSVQYVLAYVTCLVDVPASIHLFF